MRGETRSSRALRHVKAHRLVKHLFFTSGKHYWEVFVSRMGKSGAVIIGAAPGEEFESETLNAPWSAWTTGAIGYAATGAIIKNGIEVGRAAPFGEGDVVSVLLDMNKRVARFFLNGHEQIVSLPDDHRPRMEQDSGGAVDPSTRTLKLCSFTQPAMFAAVTFSPDSDELDIYSMHAPPHAN
ncbi:hypothetical protein PINS_up009993 [Pythium insidiosum]|nr:hypothetical protein PINS_up009993 [Pythium insidiosum]